MKTAAEMRATNPKFLVQNTIDEIEKAIMFANRQGWTEIRLANACTHPDRFSWVKDWTSCIDNKTIESIVLVLRDLGYKVTVLYEEKQFVDMDIIISWAG